MQIVDICRVMSISYSSKVKFTMLICILADVTSMCRHIEVYTSIELFIHCGCSSLGKWLCIDILWLHTGNKACISWNMLCLNVLCGTSNPVVSFLGLIGELNLEVIIVLGRDARIQNSLGMRNWAPASHQWAVCVIERTTWLINNDAVSFSSCLSEDLHLFGDVTGVAREILFFEVDFLWHIAYNNCFS
jgi:hypothetical protein